MRFSGRFKSPPWVLVVRLALPLGAGIAVLFSYGARPDKERREATAAQIYTCPMHPDVRTNVPGACAICGMALEPVSLDGPSARVTPAHIAGRSPDGRVRVGSAAAERLAVTAEVRAPAWVEAPGRVTARVYDDELPWVDPESRGSFSQTAIGSTRIEIERSEEPPVAWDRSTSDVRFHFDRAVDLPVGAVGWVSFPAKPRPSLIVPSAGILESADGPYVIVLGSDGTYEKRPVHIGKILNRYAFIVTGLREHERVAVNDAFVLDAERRVHGFPELVQTAPP